MAVKVAGWKTATQLGARGETARFSSFLWLHILPAGRKEGHQMASERPSELCLLFRQKRSLSGPTNYFKVREDLLEHLCSPLRSFVRKKNLNHLLILVNHPRIMSDHSYDILLKRGRCLLSCSDDKDKDKMLKTSNACHIFEKQRVQGYQM